MSYYIWNDRTEKFDKISEKEALDIISFSLASMAPLKYKITTYKKTSSKGKERNET